MLKEQQKTGGSSGSDQSHGHANNLLRLIDRILTTPAGEWKGQVPQAEMVADAEATLGKLVAQGMVDPNHLTTLNLPEEAEPENWRE